MSNAKPFVLAALVCERVLVEKDNVLSAIRVLDKLTFNDPPSQGATPVGAEVAVLVRLVAGDSTGRHELAVMQRHPGGATTPIGQWPVVFEKQDSGANLIARVFLTTQEWGTYWIDVQWDGEPLTSIPVTLLQRESQEAPPS